MMNEEKSYTTEDLLLFIDKLRRENQQLKATNESLTSLVNSCQKEIRKYKEVIEEVREVIENEIPYLYEIDKEYENVEGNTYFTYKEYDNSKLLQILDKAKGE